MTSLCNNSSLSKPSLSTTTLLHSAIKVCCGLTPSHHKNLQKVWNLGAIFYKVDDFYSILNNFMEFCRQFFSHQSFSVNHTMCKSYRCITSRFHSTLKTGCVSRHCCGPVSTYRNTVLSLQAYIGEKSIYFLENIHPCRACIHLLAK